MMNDVLERSSKATRTHPKHVPFSDDTKHQSFQTIDKTNTMYNHNGNNVDIDSEMAALAKNQIYYQALVDRLNGKFNSLQTEIGRASCRERTENGEETGSVKGTR